MKVVVIAERNDIRTGRTFKTAHIFNHQPVVFNRNVAGWQGEGAGLSSVDLKRVIKELGAFNVVSFSVQLTEM